MFLHFEYQPSYFYIQQTQTNPSGRSGPPLLVNTNVHWGQLNYLSSTTSQPNTKNRKKALATINRQVRDLPTPLTREASPPRSTYIRAVKSTIQTFKFSSFLGSKTSIQFQMAVSFHRLQEILLYSVFLLQSIQF